MVTVEVNNEGSKLFVVYRGNNENLFARYNIYDLKWEAKVELRKTETSPYDNSGLLKQSKVSDLFCFGIDKVAYILKGSTEGELDLVQTVSVEFSNISRVMPCPTRDEFALYTTSGSRRVVIIGNSDRKSLIYNPALFYKESE